MNSMRFNVEFLPKLKLHYECWCSWDWRRWRQWWSEWWCNFVNNFMPFTLCNEGNTKYIVNLSSLRHKLSCAQRKNSAELFRWNTCWPKHFSNRVDHVPKQQRVVKLQTFNVLRKLIRFEQGKCTLLAQLSSFSHLNIHKGLFKNWANRAMS